MMSYPLLSLHNIGHFYGPKACFSALSAPIVYGQKIALLGQNGSGKSTLLRLICDALPPAQGHITYYDHHIAYVPQLGLAENPQSGSEQFQKNLSQAIATQPHLLCLDEPTNHLDQHNRQRLMTFLKRFPGALIIATHDQELIRFCTAYIWHIQDHQVHLFDGTYDAYQQTYKERYGQIEKTLQDLKHQSKQCHESLMKEQKRAHQQRLKGIKNIQNRKWATVKSPTKVGRMNQTTTTKKSAISKKRAQTNDALHSLRMPEVMRPTFSFGNCAPKGKILLSIQDASVGYMTPLISDINLTVRDHQKMALQGPNASGKSTLLKAIMGDPKVSVTGHWQRPLPSTIGYLDQHYHILPNALTTFEIIKSTRPSWTDDAIRKHLNDFLFRKNEDVFSRIQTLSGGEKARLALATIAAQAPALLLLDEVTNNMDLETKEHVITVLNAYPGALVIISHDNDFLSKLELDQWHRLHEGKFVDMD